MFTGCVLAGCSNIVAEVGCSRSNQQCWLCEQRRICTRVGGQGEFRVNRRGRGAVGTDRVRRDVEPHGSPERSRPRR
ncbi:hypothetical protein CPI83_25795 [Rhodococcus sp. H-CA8f]|nr:hypothetical protein CPI83_25795 [Rhodococcus sp. H-CA8f]